MLTLKQVKDKSAPRLNGLQPVVKQAAVLLIERSYARGVPILITQGLRTIAEQDALYAQGRTKPGAIVTNAKGGSSYHNYGLAIDFALLMPDGKSASWDMKRDGDGDKAADWLEVVEEAKKLGFEWGGDWKSFKDNPHFQMAFGLTCTQLKNGAKPDPTKIEAMFNKMNALKEEQKMPAERDINKVSPWAEAVWKDMTDKKYFDGNRPGAPITREEMAVVLSRLINNLSQK